MVEPSSRPDAVRVFARLAAFTTIVTLVLIALGGTVRATDSGLACPPPNWPGCFSNWDFFPAPDVNVWLEHSHRLLGSFVGLLIAVLTGYALLRLRDRRDLVRPAVAALVAVAAQGALGAEVVRRFLKAELVTAHLLGALVVVAVLLVAIVNARVPAASRGPLDRAGRLLVWTSAAVAGLTLVQALVGSHMAGVGGGLEFADRPGLGLAAAGPLDGTAEVFNLLHRVLAAAVVVAIGVLIVVAKRAGARGWLARLPHVASGLVVLQILLGVANLWTELAALTVVPHLVVASWMVTVLVLHTLLARRAGVPVEDVPAAPAPPDVVSQPAGRAGA